MGRRIDEIRTYSELISLQTFGERFDYLNLNGFVGSDTFGFDRYLNQQFYRSKEWKTIRRDIILRDNGCDLGIEDREILDRIYIHHMNPIDPKDIIDFTEYLTNPEFLICCSLSTHNAIHYGSKDNLVQEPIVRTMNDTCPWKH